MNTLQTLMERVEIYWCPNGCQYFPKRKRNTADEFLGNHKSGYCRNNGSINSSSWGKVAGFEEENSW